MKILVVSLLRLGDIIQQEPLLRGLRAKYPEAQIHLLLNRQFAGVERVLGGLADRYIPFDRETIQRGLGESGFNILWSYSQVENLVQALSAEKYDIAMNFTHNRLSAYLLGALEIADKRGLYQERGRFRGLNGRWIRYFNDRFSGNQKSLFHYVELLGRSFDIPVQVAAPVAEKKRGKTVLLQCLTSDPKKNWGLENFRQLKRIIEQSLVDYQVRVLGASFERETLAQVFPEKDLLICDLAEARTHLGEAALLVTGDTSIKHLAAQQGTPLVELVLGSSDVVKTGAFAANVQVLESGATCSPCVHSQACGQPSHLCGDMITVESVFGAVWDQLSGEKIKRDRSLAALEKATWTLFLDKENRDVEPFYTQAVLSLTQDYTADVLHRALAVYQERTEIYLSWQKRITQALPRREELAARRTVQSSDVAELVLVAQDILKSKKDEAGYFQGFVEALLARYAQPLQIHDRVQAALEEQAELLAIRENLTTYLQSLSREGAYYAKGIGQLSIGGFEETGKSLQRDLEDAEL